MRKSHWHTYQRIVSMILVTVVFAHALIVSLAVFGNIAMVPVKQLGRRNNTSRPFNGHFNAHEQQANRNSTDVILGAWIALGASGQKQTVITIYPGRGRLGNQMFQVASLLGIASRYGHKPFIPFSTFDLQSVFSLPYLQTLNKTKFSEFKEVGADLFDERDIAQYVDLSLLQDHENWTLNGYFQSYKHFMHIGDTLRRLFTFQDYVMDAAKDFLQNNIKPTAVKVGVHVRRGDFLSDYHKKLGRTLPDADYFRRAMDYFKERFQEIAFVVLSNDIAWCIDNLHDDRHQVLFSPFKQPGYDLALMSLCDHMIMSVGTYGWWGGWLAGGTTVYYKGYPKPGSEMDKYFIREDFYPPDWIGML